MPSVRVLCDSVTEYRHMFSPKSSTPKIPITGHFLITINQEMTTLLVIGILLLIISTAVITQGY
jgi:hypothetical protein